MAKEELHEANSLSTLDENLDSLKSLCKVSQRQKGEREDHLKVATGKRRAVLQLGVRSGQVALDWGTRKGWVPDTDITGITQICLALAVLLKHQHT